jgi:hypothetical protein
VPALVVLAELVLKAVLKMATASLRVLSVVAVKVVMAAVALARFLIFPRVALIAARGAVVIVSSEEALPRMTSPS